MVTILNAAAEEWLLSSQPATTTEPSDRKARLRASSFLAVRFCFLHPSSEKLVSRSPSAAQAGVAKATSAASANTSATAPLPTLQITEFRCMFRRSTTCLLSM